MSSTTTRTTATMTSTTTRTIATINSTITVTTATMTTTATISITTTLSSTDTLTSATTALTATTTTTLVGATTTPTTQRSTTTMLWSVRASMSFVSEGTEEQVESAVSIALATHHGVPLSVVTVEGTVEYRRLRTARELTSSKSWTVDYLIVGDASVIDEVHDSATELSDAANATALESFADLLMAALSGEGVDNSEQVQVTHTAPQKSVITASTTTTTTTEEETTMKATGEHNDYRAAAVGVIASVVIALCALACCCVSYRQCYKSRQRAVEERQDMMLSMDIPEVSEAPSTAGAGRLTSPGVASEAGSSAARRSTIVSL